MPRHRIFQLVIGVALFLAGYGSSQYRSAAEVHRLTVAMQQENAKLIAKESEITARYEAVVQFYERQARRIQQIGRQR